jgi:hypothetical protein
MFSDYRPGPGKPGLRVMLLKGSVTNRDTSPWLSL